MSAPDFDDLLRRIRERAAAQHPAPPATEAELAKAEESLGFALPPLLRRLYGEIGNGGFGPGCLLPLFTPPNWPPPREFPGGVVNRYHHYREEALEASLDDDPSDPRLRHWKARRLPISDLGCNMDVCVDSDKPGLPVWRVEYPGIRREAPSLVAWLERWLSQPPQPMRHAHWAAPRQDSAALARAFLEKLKDAPPIAGSPIARPQPPTPFPATMPTAAPDPAGAGAAVGWFLKERVGALQRTQPRLSRAELEETLAREAASMFGLTRDAALAQVKKVLPG
ncbi:MAG TPA: SMI1/KNR4 family protein [Chthoniobacteraceae bacterium]|nr:SMI1/KNR4 family protein [Chthoniobacteraceae bacterium]